MKVNLYVAYKQGQIYSARTNVQIEIPSKDIIQNSPMRCM